jgi:hypothetical protein
MQIRFLDYIPKGNDQKNTTKETRPKKHDQRNTTKGKRTPNNGRYPVTTYKTCLLQQHQRQ